MCRPQTNPSSQQQPTRLLLLTADSFGKDSLPAGKSLVATVSLVIACLVLSEMAFQQIIYSVKVGPAVRLCSLPPASMHCGPFPPLDSVYPRALLSAMLATMDESSSHVLSRFRSLRTAALAPSA